MKKDKKMEIRNTAWRTVWEEYKGEYTMEELAEILNASLPTFFRAVKKVDNKKK